MGGRYGPLNREIILTTKKQTAEQIPQGGEPVRQQAVLAGFTVRAIAALYDLAIVFGLLFIVIAPVAVAEHYLGSMPVWIKTALEITVIWAYFVGFWSRSGETTGMRPWRLTLVMADSGNFPSPAACTIRFAVMIATWLAAAFVLLSMLTGKTQNTTYATVALLPFISLACLALSKRQQALHDLAAGILVVRRAK